MEGTIVLKHNSGSRRPETESQAAAWERVKKFALEFGLCHACASQLAWGHQSGFAAVHPPCASCAAVVRRLPVAKLNGWSTVAGVASDRRSWAALSVRRGRSRGAAPERAGIDAQRARGNRQEVAA